ncbi:phosphoribosylformylglycinamidine synthase subunit PurL [Calycomorphotria hydatis]|uniref:Phosphoribosylformylglycinamidine synthase subunit PurL n=1 Tax=Calycomorphotria hydatis TaxID=2528027 RepID=A0A517TAI9_9PLAN|nr:phosphoribosylformylglycinamidine synthase subunit PurL [Calycomorphotria hydatis]QDT65386.1 Phosphoribosylformylglycinamidine synthase subunit PurL [Calycomorphotria hydatis]
MLWEVEVLPLRDAADAEAQHVLSAAQRLGLTTIQQVTASRSFLIESNEPEEVIQSGVVSRLTDSVVESSQLKPLPDAAGTNGSHLMTVLFKPGVTDNVANSTLDMLQRAGLAVDRVATTRKYRFANEPSETDLSVLGRRVLANDAIEYVVEGALQLESIALGQPYQFDLQTVSIRDMDDAALEHLSRHGQLYLSLEEMRTIQKQFQELDRDPTDCELETVAQTWSEHCSHKTLAGRIRYREQVGLYEKERSFENMLKETIFAATQEIRRDLGENDWCVSVFKDNAGIVTFDEQQNVCFKAETHNHPSALEPYGGANTGIGGVIRDPMGTGLGAKPVCNTDVFCFAPPERSIEDLPPGVLHPRAVAEGVVAGVRDYGNRMGIPTVNGAVLFDERYLGNPLVFCGNVAMIPVDRCEKRMQPGDYIVALGGRTGRDGIHGATFSSAELTEESETLSGGAVQIGNAVMEKMVLDVLMQARDKDLYSAITDCGAGGFSSAVGEMGEETGAEVWLEKAPLKYEGLSYTEIWISEAQERMVLAVPPENWEEFNALCAAEGVEATHIGVFTDTNRLLLKYHGEQVADLSMEFLHDGRPRVIRDAVYQAEPQGPVSIPTKERFDDDLAAILSSLNVCSKEWVIRQYDHEVQSGSVVKPLVGVQEDGPSDAAVVRPDLYSTRGLVISCGINPDFGDIDPAAMAASAIDEAVRNCIAVGADPDRIAILDNFCWGNCERAETLGTLVRAAIACHDVAIAYGTPFISGKDSLNNEFSFEDKDGNRQTVSIPPTLLISALGQIDDVSTAVTMDLKEAGDTLYLVGETKSEFGGSHYTKINSIEGGAAPLPDVQAAPTIFRAMHKAISAGTVRSCHDLSEGGLAVAVAEMAFAGGLGVELTVPAGELNDAEFLFSESNTRFLVEVSAEQASAFEEAMAGVPHQKLGTVTDNGFVRVTGQQGTTVIESSITDLKECWQRPLDWD